MKSKYWAMAAAAIAIIPLTACGKSSSSSGSSQTISKMTNDVIATMDSAQFTDAVSSQALTDTMAGLYRYKGTTLKPDMAKSKATVSKDQKTYTFHLHHDAKWSDGKKVTAQDFEYAWKRVVNPATKSPYAYIFSGIKNADAILAGKADYKTLGVKATSKYTFVVKLDRPMPYFESMICLQTFDPLEKSTVEKYGKKYANTSKQMTFNGPYILKNWSGANNSWTEVKNPNYWNAKNVHVKKLKYQVVKENSTALNLYESGKLDDVSVTGSDAQQSKSEAGYNVVKQNFITYLTMNKQQVPEFGNQKVRQALSMTINRKEFIKKVLGDGSTPAQTPVPTNMMYSDSGKDFGKEAAKGVTEYTSYNVAKAKKLFAEGMKEMGSSKLNFTLITQDSASDKSTSEYLQNAFSKLSGNGLSVNVTVKSVPQKTWLALGDAHNYGMMIGLWGADYPDSSNFLNRWTSTTSDFAGAWNNKEYDKLIANAAGKDVLNKTKRWNDLQKATKLITKDMGVIPIYQWGSAHLTKTSIKGMQYVPNSQYQYIGATNKK